VEATAVDTDKFETLQRVEVSRKLL